MLQGSFEVYFICAKNGMLIFVLYGYLFLVHLIIATPGRILDLMNKNIVKTDNCNMLVLDEVRFFRGNLGPTDK